MRNITLLTFMIPVGIMVAAQILVGNNVGANRIDVGKAYAKMCVQVAAMWALGTIGLLLLFKGPFIGVFTDSEAVSNVIMTAYPIMLLYVFFDCVQCVGQGMIRGLGKQGPASIGTVIGYWLIGIPTSLLCVFSFDMGIIGLWLGPTLAIFFNFCFYYSMVVFSDWQLVANEAKERREKELIKKANLSKSI